MSDGGKKAVILMGHGSRVPDAGKCMEKVAARLRELSVSDIVDICYMERLGPRFPQVFEKCIKLGATEVVLIPYFLHLGLHTRTDIPSMMKLEAAKYPNVKLVFGKNLGFDELLVELVAKRVEESHLFDDVRNLHLNTRDHFRLQPNDRVYVPMEQDEAEQYLSKNPDASHPTNGKNLGR